VNYGASYCYIGLLDLSTGGKVTAARIDKLIASLLALRTKAFLANRRAIAGLLGYWKSWDKVMAHSRHRLVRFFRATDKLVAYLRALRHFIAGTGKEKSHLAQITGRLQLALSRASGYLRAFAGVFPGLGKQLSSTARGLSALSSLVAIGLAPVSALGKLFGTLTTALGGTSTAIIALSGAAALLFGALIALPYIIEVLRSGLDLLRTTFGALSPILEIIRHLIDALFVPFRMLAEILRVASVFVRAFGNMLAIVLAPLHALAHALSLPVAALRLFRGALQRVLRPLERLASLTTALLHPIATLRGFLERLSGAFVGGRRRVRGFTSAAQGLMLAMSILEGNLRGVLFTMIFLYRSVPKVTFTVAALTVTILGLARAGAMVEDLLFRFKQLTGSIKEATRAYILAHTWAIRLGRTSEEVAATFQLLYREGLLSVEALKAIATMAAATGKTMEEAASLYIRAIGRERENLKALEDVGIRVNSTLIDLSNRRAVAEAVNQAIFARWPRAMQEYARTGRGAWMRIKAAIEAAFKILALPVWRIVFRPALLAVARFAESVYKLVRALAASERAARFWADIKARLVRISVEYREELEALAHFLKMILIGAIYALAVALRLAIWLFERFLLLVRLLRRALGWLGRILKPLVEWFRRLLIRLKALRDALRGTLAGAKAFLLGVRRIFQLLFALLRALHETWAGAFGAMGLVTIAALGAITREIGSFIITAGVILGRWAGQVVSIFGQAFAESLVATTISLGAILFEIGKFVSSVIGTFISWAAEIYRIISED